jgi:hypothetical protein
LKEEEAAATVVTKSSDQDSSEEDERCALALSLTMEVYIAVVVVPYCKLFSARRHSKKDIFVLGEEDDKAWGMFILLLVRWCSIRIWVRGSMGNLMC